jgi:hypothetical protein
MSENDDLGSAAVAAPLMSADEAINVACAALDDWADDLARTL